MKKILILFIILMPVLAYAQLTNTSYWRWFAINDYYTNSFDNSTNIITNFYKFVVLPQGQTYNGFAGNSLFIRENVHNVGSIDDTTGIKIGLGCNVTGVTLRLWNDNNPADGNEFNSSVDTLNSSNKTPPLNSGENFYYFVEIRIPSSASGYIEVYITNTGTMGTSPYPYQVIVTNTVRAVYQNVLVREITDGIHIVRIYDGSEYVGDIDTKVYVEVQGEVLDPGSVKLYYDVGGIPDASPPDGTINKNRVVNLVREGNYWVGTISSLDPEIKVGSLVNFIISVDGNLYYYDESTTTPWRYRVRQYEIQPEESEHTVSVNNKFDPDTEKYYLIYKLNNKSHVNISVYNIRGELVRQLKNAVVEPGRHSVAWDGRNEYGKRVSPGLYLVIIHTAEYGDIRKVVVIK